MTPSEASRLKACELRLQRLTSDLSNTGFISSGSVVRRFMPCGKLGCRCQADPPQLHGPYWQWNRVVKTVTRRLTEGQASLYQGSDGSEVVSERRSDGLIEVVAKCSLEAARVWIEAHYEGVEWPKPRLATALIGRLRGGK